jgi:hypothetical protein
MDVSILGSTVARYLPLGTWLGRPLDLLYSRCITTLNLCQELPDTRAHRRLVELKNKEAAVSILAVALCCDTWSLFCDARK